MVMAASKRTNDLDLDLVVWFVASSLAQLGWLVHSLVQDDQVIALSRVGRCAREGYPRRCDVDVVRHDRTSSSTKLMCSLISISHSPHRASWLVPHRRSYPSIAPELQPILVARSRLESPSLTQFVFSKFENHWLYFFATVLHQQQAKSALAIDFDSGNAADDEEEQRSGPLPRVNAFTIFLVTKVRCGRRI